MNEINIKVQKWLCAKVVLRESGSVRKWFCSKFESMTHTQMQMNELNNIAEVFQRETGSAKLVLSL